MSYVTDAAREYAKKRIKKTKVKDNDESLYDYIDELLEETSYDNKPTLATCVVNGATGKQIDKDRLKFLFERVYGGDDVNEFIYAMKLLTEIDIGKIEREHDIKFNKNEKDAFIKKGMQNVFNTLNNIYGDFNIIYRKKKDELEKLKALSRAEKDKIMFNFLNKKYGLTESEITKYKAVARTLTLDDIIAHNLWHIFGTMAVPGDSPAGILLEHAYKNDFNSLPKDDIEYLNEYLSTVDDPLSLLYEELDDNDGLYADIKLVDKPTLSKLKQLVKKGYETVRSMQ